MDAPNLTVERVEELREWLENVYDDFTYDDNCFLSPKGEQAQADLLALLDKEAASLAGQPAAPCGEDEITTKQLMTRLDVMDDHYKDTMFCGDWPVLGFKRHNAEVDAIRARLAQPKPRVSREWVRFQAGEIWSAKTLEDAIDTLADTLKGFGVNVEEE